MNYVQTLQSNTDGISRSGSFVRGHGQVSVSGVVSGMLVQQVPQSLELQVTPGVAVVNGCYFELSSLYNNLVPPASLAVVDGLQVLVCLHLNRNTQHGLNRFNQQVAQGTTFSFTFSVIALAAYVYSADTLILGSCRYSIALRDTSISSSALVQLPAGVFGIYTDLPVANTALFGTSVLDAFTNTSNFKAGDSCVVSTNTGTTLSLGTALTVYRWMPVQDPASLAYTILLITGSYARENLQTTVVDSGPFANYGFRIVGVSNTYVTFNANGIAYTVSYGTHSGTVSGVSVDVTVYATTSSEPITVTGVLSSSSASGTLDFIFTLPGDIYEHTVSLAWSVGTSQNVDGLWSNVSGSQFMAFAFDTLGYALPWQRFDWELSTPSFNVLGFDSNYFYEIIGITSDIDVSGTTYPFVHPMYSGNDVVHTSKRSVFATHNNPHGSGFNDIGYGTMPIHKQLFDSGFGISTMTTHGIVGLPSTETIPAENIRTDYFGNVTGTLCNRYLQLQHVPLNVASLVDSTSGANVAYNLLNDVVVLGPDFVGGDFGIYPAFVKTNVYTLGTRVTHTASGVTHLYTCLVPWTANPSASDTPAMPYFQELSPVGVRCVYFYIPDLEYTKASDTLISFTPNNNDPVITEGVVVEPNAAATTPLTFNMGQYKGISLPKMTLSLSGSGEIVSTDQVLDVADLSTRQSSQASLAGVSVGACQLKMYLTRTPNTYQLAPLQGHLIITSKRFYGRVRLFYTYGVTETTVFTTTQQVSSFVGGLDLSSAQLLEGVNYIPRSSWEYSYDTKQVIIASDVYVSGRSYRLVRRATESQRNQSGFVEVIGTGAKPVGRQAIATVKCQEYNRLAQGDSVSVSIPGKPVITKVLQSVAGYTGFVQGPDIPTTLQSLADALNQDPVFAASDSYAYLVVNDDPTVLYIRAGDPGASGNDYAVSVNYTNTSLQSSLFTGGVDHKWVFDDLSGLAYSLNDMVVQDTYGYFSVWSTGSLDHGWDSTKYYCVDILDDDGTGSIHRALGTQTGTQALTSANWTLGEGWTGDYTTGFFRWFAGTDKLSNSIAYKANAVYHVKFTLTGHQSGSLLCTIGGVEFTVTRTVVEEFVFTATDSLIVIPTQDFIGHANIEVEYIADYYDASTETQLSVQITGLDSEDNTLQETLVLNTANFCDVQNHRIVNPYTNVRSKNLYARVLSWSVLDSANVGSSQMTLVAESSSGTRDLFDLCDVSWNGNGVNYLRDQRHFIDAYTNKPTADTTAEALSTVAALLQFQLTSATQGP